MTGDSKIRTGEWGERHGRRGEGMGWEDEGRDAIGRGGEKKDNAMISGKKN